MNKRVELVFGSGQFVCVGRGVAMVELNKVLAEVSRYFTCKVWCGSRVLGEGSWVEQLADGFDGVAVETVSLVAG
jgi:cytochrome P450